MLIEGVFAAVPTPFYPDEKIYFRKLEANVSRYSRSLLSGMVVLGSTGEAVALTDAESRDVLKTVGQAAAPDKVLIAGVGRESVKATVEMAEAAAEYNFDAVLVRTPTYYAPQMTRAAVLHHFRSVADRSPLPVLLYHIPKFVPYDFPVDVVAELAQHPNIIGIKDSSGNVDRIRTVVELTRSAPRRSVTVTPVFEAVTQRMLTARAEVDAAALIQLSDMGGGGIAVPPLVAPIKTRTKEVGFQVLSGSAGALFESLEAGASGAILAFAACAPQACTEIYLAWKDHDPNLAREKQERIAGPSQRIAGQLGLNGVKAACDFNGYYGGRARAPLIPLTADQRAEVESLLANIRN
jgi:4-hydroxy-2-oxoglutarate aldolase